MAWRARARIVPGSAWFISGWIIAGYFANGFIRCRQFNLGCATRSSHSEKEKSQSVYRIDAAAQATRCHDHHFGYRRGVAQSERNPAETGRKFGRERSTHGAALDYGQSRRT